MKNKNSVYLSNMHNFGIWAPFPLTQTINYQLYYDAHNNTIPESN
jgi:hypothetical protein